MPEISDDEFTLLEIMSRGESMMPIGRWEKSLKGLAAKGMADPRGGFNYIITEKGRAALGGHKEEIDDMWARAYIRANNELVANKAKQEKPGAFVIQGALFFRLLDGSTVYCNCIKEPYASKIVELFNGRNAGQERLGRAVVQQLPEPSESHPKADDDSGDEQPKGD